MAEDKTCSGCGAMWIGSNAERDDMYACGKGRVFMDRGVCPVKRAEELLNAPKAEYAKCEGCGGTGQEEVWTSGGYRYEGAKPPPPPPPPPKRVEVVEASPWKGLVGVLELSRIWLEMDYKEGRITDRMYNARLAILQGFEEGAE